LPHKSNTRNAWGMGTIRQRKDGTWEGRYTIGRDPGTGKQIQKSVYGKTQKEVSKELKAISVTIDEGDYSEPSKFSVSAWLSMWLEGYNRHLKPYSLRNYKSQVNNHIIPYIGAIKLVSLSTDMIIRMYNKLLDEENLSPKTLRNIHGILHSALEQAIENKYIKTNPAAACAKKLPKVTRKKFVILADDDMKRFIEAIQGSPYENLFLVDIFTGMRQGELLGLTWANVNFTKGTIVIEKQLYMPEKGGSYYLETLKNRKTRTLYPAKFVMDILKQQRKDQIEARLTAGEMWDEGEMPNLVFTTSTGRYINHKVAYKHFKQLAASCGIPQTRFHDMRHSYAVASLRAGDDVKSLQENLGHHSAAFTLDQYGDTTEQMKKEGSARMDKFIQNEVLIPSKKR
jgi:integrase